MERKNIAKIDTLYIILHLLIKERPNALQELFFKTNISYMTILLYARKLEQARYIKMIREGRRKKVVLNDSIFDLYNHISNLYKVWGDKK